MADIDPPVDDIFAGMKKKKKGSKKAAVNLDELDVDAPAAAAPSNDATSVSGSGAAANLAAAPTPADAAGAESDGELDFSSIKKKKKKSVRIDSDVEDAADLEDSKPKSKKRVDNLGNEVDDEQPTDEVTAVDASGMDEFADLKKKRKKSSKKAFDLDAFEKELAEAEATQGGGGGDEPKSILKKPTPAGSDDEGAEENDDDEDEPVEGEDPFGKDDHDDSRASKAEAAANAKAWLTEDRDYTYTEVSRHGQTNCGPFRCCSVCF